MSNAIVAAVQARLAAAYPAWLDATDDPHPTPDSKMPSYAVAVTYADAEPLGMGDVRYLRQGQLTVTLRMAGNATGFTGEAGAHAEAQGVEAVILADPRYLGNLLWDITPEGFEADHEAGAQRISQGDLIFAIETIE